ncbi:hypothetical protein [Desulfovibrio inopinatus]|uniref:hypothetical protein n=1 Tax=Desulfovibrio inopinatus TaxID=102109 RepID=UPI0003F9AA94|nr:hypothetical protein [Desulfovibrio inopinatus]
MRIRTVACFALCLTTMLVGCQTSSRKANEIADQQMVQRVSYSSTPGPTVVVIPGEIKSANATYAQKISSNNIADFAEIELGRANFKVLDRADLGAIQQEFATAATMGDPRALSKLKRGKFKTTNEIIRFDILKAEPVANVKTEFDGTWLGIGTGALVGGLTGSVAAGIGSGAVVGSAQAHDETGIWIVGLRYKVIDANTGEQVASDYFEDKMEINSSGGGFLGVSQSESSGTSLDSMTQRLIQRAVQDLDKRLKPAFPN